MTSESANHKVGQMVSFSCEACGDILKKPKLDQHAGRCRGAYYTCVDCNNTFDGPTGNNGYRAHTSCMSEEQRYHKSVYKEPKKKGKQQQQQQQQNSKPEQTSQQPPAAADPTPAASTESEDSKKRAREEETQKVGESTVNGSSAEKAEEKETGEGEPSKKKKKKSKKNKGEKEVGESGEASNGQEPEKQESLSSFLSSTLPSILAESVSIVTLKEKILSQAKEKGFTNEKEVEEALFAGMSVGGKKSKVKYNFE
ncbi:hypothetical protein JCM5350_005302 [Sporobolomyces pararoseus]